MRNTRRHETGTLRRTGVLFATLATLAGTACSTQKIAGNAVPGTTASRPEDPQAGLRKQFDDLLTRQASFAACMMADKDSLVKPADNSLSNVGSLYGPDWKPNTGGKPGVYMVAQRARPAGSLILRMQVTLKSNPDKAIFMSFGVDPKGSFARAKTIAPDVVQNEKIDFGQRRQLAYYASRTDGLEIGIGGNGQPFSRRQLLESPNARHPVDAGMLNAFQKATSELMDTLLSVSDSDCRQPFSSRGVT